MSNTGAQTGIRWLQFYIPLGHIDSQNAWTADV